jgi:DnaJ like chaperone protein
LRRRRVEDGQALGVWGKVIGGVAGFFTGGPIGALVGAALGHAADTGAAGPGGAGRALPPGAATLAALLGSKEQLFAIGVVVLSAKLAKCDGPVRREEIDAFKRMFRIPPENLREVGRLFDSARENADGWQAFAERLGTAFADNKAMLEDVLAALFHIARADGPLTRAEVAFLQGVQVRFGLDAAAWERARDGRTTSSSAAAPVPNGPDPYTVLGVPRDASDEAVRQAWRRLMRENHPDSLAARGVPADFVKRATNKVAEINAAWDRIKRERKL